LPDVQQPKLPALGAREGMLANKRVTICADAMRRASVGGRMRFHGTQQGSQASVGRTGVIICEQNKTKTFAKRPPASQVTARTQFEISKIGALGIRWQQFWNDYVTVCP
jgi:hypothetical protein